jgi:AraC-like DNA-binding protein
MQDLCGPQWLPSMVTIASSAPSDLRPCQKYFRAPLQFDEDKTALIFESKWRDCPLPIVDPLTRRRVEAEVQARQAEILSDFPRTIRLILRTKLLTGKFSMDSVAAMLDMHRRTLDRRLNQHGMHYGQVVESVKNEVACQLLRDTHLPIHQVARSLGYTTAGNFSTAFHRWTGVAPSTYRRLSPPPKAIAAAHAAKRIHS